MTTLQGSAQQFCTALFALLAFTTPACSGRAGESSPSQDKPFRVALLTPGPISDQSWNGGAYSGLMAIRDSLAAKASHIQTKTPPEFDENFGHYGAQGNSS